MEVHTWKERTEEGTLVYRACHHASKWKLECAPKVGRAERDDVEWEHVGIHAGALGDPARRALAQVPAQTLPVAFH